LDDPEHRADGIVRFTISSIAAAMVFAPIPGRFIELIWQSLSISIDCTLPVALIILRMPSQAAIAAVTVRSTQVGYSRSASARCYGSSGAPQRRRQRLLLQWPDPLESQRSIDRETAQRQVYVAQQDRETYAPKCKWICSATRPSSSIAGPWETRRPDERARFKDGRGGTGSAQ
jgi:hypothetical protein